jgi:hypothetical protein
MTINYFSEHWTPEEKLQWKETFIPILSGCSLICCIVAQIIYCIPQRASSCEVFFDLFNS